MNIRLFLFCLLLSLFASALIVNAQTTTVTIEARTQQVADNFDLEAVARLFGESRSLDEFEKSLNGDIYGFSNLDLNMDGYVDYIRVVEIMDGMTHYIVLQAVLGDDLYQDIATIIADSHQNTAQTSITIVGDPYIYGNDYVLTTTFTFRPHMYAFFWNGLYACYVSPFHWNCYPAWFHHMHVCPPYVYHRRLHHHCWLTPAPSHVIENRHVFRSARMAEVSRRDYARHYDRHEQRIAVSQSSRHATNVTSRRTAATPSQPHRQTTAVVANPSRSTVGNSASRPRTNATQPRSTVSRSTQSGNTQPRQGNASRSGSNSSTRSVSNTTARPQQSGSRSSQQTRSTAQPSQRSGSVSTTPTRNTVSRPSGNASGGSRSTTATRSSQTMQKQTTRR